MTRTRQAFRVPRGTRSPRLAGLVRGTLLGAVVLGATVACEDPGARPTTTVQATDSADQVLEGFSHWVTQDGIRRSEV
jgi:hypothetical protein